MFQVRATRGTGAVRGAINEPLQLFSRSVMGIAAQEQREKNIPAFGFSSSQ